MPTVVNRALFTAMIVVSLVVLFAPGSDVPHVRINDKVVHGLLFAALAVTGYLAGIPVVPLAVGLIAYAGVSEVLQAVLPIDRDGDVKDALTDVVGAALGLLVTSTLLQVGQKR